MLTPIISEEEAEKYLPNWAYSLWLAESLPKTLFKIGDRVFDILYGYKYKEVPFGTVTWPVNTTKPGHTNPLESITTEDPWPPLSLTTT